MRCSLDRAIDGNLNQEPAMDSAEPDARLASLESTE